MAKISSKVANSKFRGCFMGVLMGDCLGAPFEGEGFTGSGKLVAQRYFDYVNSNKKALFKAYTDDYAMTKSVATSLVEKQTMDCDHMVKTMTTEFFHKPQRGYGQNATDTFVKLRDSRFKDIFEPAKIAFDGHGSLGNGGAMRVAPFALFYHNNFEGMRDAIVNSTKLTHTHCEGINGALLQAIAVHNCFMTPPEDDIKVDEFVSQLIEGMKSFEGIDSGAGMDEPLYKKQLEYMKKILSKSYESQFDQDCDVVKLLGNTVQALHSVPTAIYCFLRAQKEIDEVKTDNVLFRSIQYAISLGGDTDTIGGMAGALAGAHLGDTVFNDNVKRHLEDSEGALELADKLFEVGSKRQFK